MLKGAVSWDENKGSIIALCIIIPTILIIGTTPLHEMGHWAMSTIDPYIEPVEFHIFDGAEYTTGDYVFSSSLGSVVVKEKYPGAFQERPLAWDIIQESICISIQVFVIFLVTLKILMYVVAPLDGIRQTT